MDLHELLKADCAATARVRVKTVSAAKVWSLDESGPNHEGLARGRRLCKTNESL
jgi:hypothetical protein